MDNLWSSLFIFLDHNETKIIDESDFQDKSIQVSNYEKTITKLQLREFMTGGFDWTPNTREVNFSLFSLFEREILDLIAQSSFRVEFLGIDPKTTSHRLSNMEYSEVIRRYFNTISASFQISKNWSDLETSISTMLTSKAPKIEDLYSDGPHLGTYSYEIGNPTLGLERTIGVEASTKYIATKGWVRLSYYLNYSPNFHTSSKMGDGYKPGADWIEWDSGSGGWLYKYQMIGAEAVITGLEADFVYLAKYIRISGSLSGILGQNLNTNQPLILIPPSKGVLNLELNPSRFLTKVQIERSFEQNS